MKNMIAALVVSASLSAFAADTAKPAAAPAPTARSEVKPEGMKAEPMKTPEPMKAEPMKAEAATTPETARSEVKPEGVKAEASSMEKKPAKKPAKKAAKKTEAAAETK